MIKNITILVSASAAAQGISLLALPILSRLYDDNTFAVYHIYSTVFTIFLMICALRYEVAILVARTDFSFRTLVRLVLRMVAFMAVVFSLVTIAIFPSIIIRFSDFAHISFVVPAMFFIGGIFSTLTYVLIRERQYRTSARVKFLQASTYSMGGIVLAFCGPLASIGLVLADLVSRVVAAGYIIKCLPNFLPIATGKLNRNHAQFIAWQFREYPLITFPGTLASALNFALIPILFAWQFDLAVAGQYALVERFILLPVGLIAGAASQVFTGDFSRHIREARKHAQKRFRYIVFVLIAIGTPGALVLYLVASSFVPFAFGKQWILAGQICQIAAPLALIQFVSGPVNMVLVICDRQSLQFTWEVVRLLLTLGLFGSVVFLGIDNPLTVMRWYVATVLVAYISHLVLSDFVAGQFDRQRQ